LRLLKIVDESTRECSSIRVRPHISSEDVSYELANLFMVRGIAEHKHANCGSELTAKAASRWLRDLEVKTFYQSQGVPGRMTALILCIGD